MVASDRLQIVVALGLALVSMVVIGVWARKLWFYSDVWDHLTTRRIGSVSDLLRPHAGHWATPAVVTTRLLYGAVGMDYWPWYFLPRLFGHAAFCFLVWRLLIWRGSDRLLAFAVYGVLLFSGVSEWHHIATVGNFFVFPSLILGAWLVARRDVPTRFDRVVLGALLLAAVSGSGQGLAVLAGILVALTATGRIRRWASPVIVVAAVYVSWYLIYGSTSARPGVSVDGLLTLPRVALDLMAAALARSLAVDPAFGPALAVAVAAAVVVLVARGRFDLFDGVLGSALAVYLALVIVGRVIPGDAQVTAPRYAYAITFILVPILIPRLVAGSTAIRWTLVLAVAAVGIGNIVELRTGLDFWEARAQESRVVVETTAALIADGEPYVGSSDVDFRAGPLRVAGLARLIDEGWRPDRSTAARIVVAARGHLRMAVWRGSSLTGDQPGTSGLVPEGCSSVAPEEGLQFEVTTAATLEMVGHPGGVVKLDWTDDYGRGTRTFRFADNVEAGRAVVTLAEPARSATVAVTARHEDLMVCGLPPNAAAGS